MNRLPNAIAIFLLAATTAQAQETIPPCVFLPDSPQNCIRFVGCINADGASFAGRSFGWNSGTVYGETSEGSICTGTWQNDNSQTKGVGDLTCDNGETATFKYFTRGEDFAGLKGVAISSQSRRMITWAAADLESYLKTKFPTGEHPGFQCGPAWIPLPDVFPAPPK
jgi:hypothetical protein